MDTQMAFRGSAEIKAGLVATMQQHEDADALVRGTYYEDNERGCFIGCAVNTKREVGEHWHTAFERLYGIDQRLAGLFDTFFENLPGGRHIRWWHEVTDAITVGADLRHVADEFQLWLLSSEESPIAFSFSEDAWGVWTAIKRVAELYRQRLGGNEPEAAAWAAARAAAGDAAWAAAYTKMADKLLVLMREAPVGGQ